MPPRERLMRSRFSHIALFVVVFLLASALRLSLAYFNWESNDPHIAVIRIILRTGRLPTKDDCPQCYQPKLFHYAAAGILRRGGMAEASRDAQLRPVQLINALAGIATIAVAWSFLHSLGAGSAAWKAVAFALVALNPKLIGINGQITNDTFVILFSSLTLYCAARFLRSGSPVTFAAVVLCAVLSISAKSSGVVTALAVFVTLVVRGFAERPRYKTLLYALLFALSVGGLSAVNPLNQYGENIRRYGSPILTNFAPPPPASLWVKSYTPYAGVLSISDAMLTFRFFSLLEDPRNERADLVYPVHRTSFWTQIYAQSHSVHFDGWPLSWRFSPVRLPNITRAIFLLALLPSGLVVTGIVMGGRDLLRGLLRRDSEGLARLHHGLFLLAALGFTASAALYAIEMRRHMAMKAIYIYPALLAFLPPFVEAASALHRRVRARSRVVAAGMFGAMTALLALYVTDVVLLIVRLRSVR